MSSDESVVRGDGQKWDAPGFVPPDQPSDPVVYCQQWEESERGWGVRPDGYSLHLTVADARQYLRGYWERQQAESPTVPDEYSRECGELYPCRVPSEVYQELVEAKQQNRCGLRFSDRNYPENLAGRNLRAWEPLSTGGGVVSASVRREGN